MTTPQAAIFPLADALDQYRRLIRYLQKNTNPEYWAAHGDWAKLDRAADSALTLAEPFLPGGVGSERTATTSHTPGPWSANQRQDRNGSPIRGAWNINHPMGRIATLELPDAGAPEYVRQRAADAALIAAAPDLLAALEALWNHLDGRPIHERLESQLSAAIARAKGQTV